MKAKIWKVLALVLMVAVTVPAAPMITPQAVTEAHAASINEKSVTIVVGETYTLSVSGSTGTVKWKSKDKTVASVNSKGVVTGIAAGKTKIVAKCDGKKYKCKVTVETSDVPTPDPSPVQTETKVYDKGNITITYLGLENKGDIYYEAKFRIENSSSQNIFVSTDDSSINGYMYYIGSLGTVNAGKSAIQNFHLSFSGMREKGIDPASKLEAEFEWHIWDSDTYKDIDSDTKCSMTF